MDGTGRTRTVVTARDYRIRSCAVQSELHTEQTKVALGLHPRDHRVVSYSVCRTLWVRSSFTNADHGQSVIFMRLPPTFNEHNSIASVPP